MIENTHLYINIQMRDKDNIIPTLYIQHIQHIQQEMRITPKFVKCKDVQVRNKYSRVTTIAAYYDEIDRARMAADMRRKQVCQI
jgi:hypothetical protein